MKKIITLGLLLYASCLFGQGTSASPIAFRIGRPINSDAFYDTTLVLRAYTETYVKNTIGDSLLGIHSSILDSLPTTLRKNIADSIAAHPPAAAGAEIHDSLLAGGSRFDTTLANKTGDGEYIWGIAGDTTWPGSFYKISTKNKWFRADTSVAVRAYGVAMDSVLKGAACRFLISGTYRKDDWPKFPPGTTVFSDSVTAGKPNIGGQAAPKKMQLYGVSIDSSIILIKIVPTLAY